MGTIFYKKKPIIGLEFSKTSLKVMSIDFAKMLVSGYGSIELEPTKIDENREDSLEYITEQLSELFKRHMSGKLGSDRTVLGIPTDRTYTRIFSLPGDKTNAITEAVNLEAEQYIPMPLESLYIDHQIIKQTAKESMILMCAAPRKLIDMLLLATKQCSLEVALIEPSMMAAARLLERTDEVTLPTIIVDIGPTTTDIAILDTAIRVTSSLSVGGNTLTVDISKKLNIPLETAHQLKVLNGLNPGPRQERLVEALRPSLSRIISEVRKVSRYYADHFPAEKALEQTIIIGSGSNIPGLGDFFSNELVMPSRVASPWQSLNFGNLEPPTKQLRPRFMTTAGLALINPQEI